MSIEPTAKRIWKTIAENEGVLKGIAQIVAALTGMLLVVLSGQSNRKSDK